MLTERLRTETKAAHLALEKTMMPLLRAASDAASYDRLLRLMDAFLQPVEDAVFQAINETVLPDAPTRRSADRLRNDLNALGTKTPEKAGKPALPANLHTDGRAWGALYVLEGSTLGGRVVREIVLRQFPGAAGATSYFDGYGDATDARWAAFKAALEQWIAVNPDEADAVVTGAEDTFAAFREWLQKAAIPA